MTVLRPSDLARSMACEHIRFTASDNLGATLPAVFMPAVSLMYFFSLDTTTSTSPESVMSVLQFAFDYSELWQAGLRAGQTAPHGLLPLHTAKRRPCCQPCSPPLGPSGGRGPRPA